MSRTSEKILLITGITILFMIPVGALAETTCSAANWIRAQALSRDAINFLGEKRFDEALAAARTAWNICPHPQIHGLMGRVHQDAGRLEDALAEYQACTTKADKDEIRETCSQRAAAIEAELAARQAAIADATPAAATAADATAPDATQTVAVAAAGEVASPVTVNEPAVEQVTEPAATHSDGPIVMVRAPASAKKTAGNWVGIGASAAAVGVGVMFLVQYGLDKSNAQDAHWDAEAEGWWAADEVGSRNLIIGASLTAAGVVGGILSAVLWPKVPIRPEVTPVNGGGVVGISVGMR